MRKAEDLHDGTLAHLSLSGAIQPTGILCVENCQFAEYAHSSDMYKAKIVLTDRSSLIVVAKAHRFLSNDRESKEQLTNMVNALEDRWSIVGYDHRYISPTWSASVTRAGHTIPAIATPYYRNGNIFDYIRLHPSVDRLDIMYQASSAFTHIHLKNVVHGNICPENSCIADDETVRVTDIAVDTLVRQMSNRNNIYVPSNWMYKSPEELQGGCRTMQTDVYSFAVTMYSAYTLKPPFPSIPHSYGNGIVQIINHEHDGIFGGSKPAMMSDGLWEIVRMCWARDPFQRPSMAEVHGMLGRMREGDR
ncbi:hypothetical protein PILCRDRAFT_817062 [Piloderma croceum F 1598]|uniref:Protein kinase domain-containing protein n=1 Tax=Piloderma croceum (strain F 1598) TaxID=765440 RepID=A0A0C3G5A7_PILCF|nr:hypothetical protein PILCRDRAFT_817062 [Piloderma croceum F 1598]